MLMLPSNTTVSAALLPSDRTIYEVKVALLSPGTMHPKIQRSKCVGVAPTSSCVTSKSENRADFSNLVVTVPKTKRITLFLNTISRM